MMIYYRKTERKMPAITRSQTLKIKQQTNNLQCYYYSVEEHDEDGFTTEEFDTEEEAKEYFDNLGKVRKEVNKVYKDNSQNDVSLYDYDPDDDEEEYEYYNYGTQEDGSFMVAGGGMMNGNAYATVENRDDKYYYCEYGKCLVNKYIGDTIDWSDERDGCRGGFNIN